jgi:hypothetical protein
MKIVVHSRHQFIRDNEIYKVGIVLWHARWEEFVSDSKVKLGIWGNVTSTKQASILAAQSRTNVQPIGPRIRAYVPQVPDMNGRISDVYLNKSSPVQNQCAFVTSVVERLLSTDSSDK